MPVVWTNGGENGRVFYNSLGIMQCLIYQAKELMRRGFLWAMKGEKFCVLL